MRYRFPAGMLVACALGLACTAPAGAQGLADVRRGQLLYDTACATCHGEQVHWRDRSLVRDWPGLVYQVTRWQMNAGQTWGVDEIRDVSAYLNHRYYRLRCPVAGCAPERLGHAGETALE